jgi:type I restriction enzyme S subunit
MSDDLPEGWALARIEELAEDPSAITYGVLKPGLPCPAGVPMLRVKDLVSGQIDRSDLFYITPELDASYRRTKLRGGEVLISVQGSVGRVAIVPRELAGANISRTLAVIPPANHEVTRWIWLALQTPQVQDDIADAVGGTTRDSLNIRDLRILELPVPPIAEQKRIVAKVEELLARVNAARERLARVPAILKRFRQSVLAAACSGKLTSDWREDRRELEPASVLLRRILAERGEKKRAVSQGVREAEGLPEPWESVPLDQILHPIRAAGYGVLQPGPDLPDGVPMVRVCDIENGTVLTKQLKRISPSIDEQYRRTRLAGGEVLVTLVGTIGRAAVAPPEVAGANIARAVAMLPVSPHVVPKFVQLALAEPSKNYELADLAREVARKTLNLGLLRAVVVPLPPAAEQCEIVRRVEALFALADAIETRVAAARLRADKLTQAVLARAFRGELVPTEAELARREGRAYEPAASLLERISTERGQGTGATTARRARSRPADTGSRRRPTRGGKGR